MHRKAKQVAFQKLQRIRSGFGCRLGAGRYNSKAIVRNLISARDAVT
jgi:hypothetical protein